MGGWSRGGTAPAATTDGREALDAGARQLWPVIREQVSRTASADQDERRLDGVLQRRRETSRAFFSSAAGEWDRLRRDLFGEQVPLLALLSLLDEDLCVGDLGCGTGQVSDALAPHVARVVAVDGSADMLREARARLTRHANVDVREGALEALPIDDGGLDVAIASLVLHYQPDPARVLAEVARVLKPGGRLLIVDMLPHERTDTSRRWDSVARVLGRVDAAPLCRRRPTEIRIRPLPVDAACGPALLAAAPASRPRRPCARQPPRPKTQDPRPKTQDPRPERPTSRRQQWQQLQARFMRSTSRGRPAASRSR